MILLMSDSIQLWITIIGVVGIIVPSVLNFIQSRSNAKGLVALKADVLEGNAEVTQLKKNTDGMQTALLDLNARANRAEGKEEGVDKEQARAAGLVTEPQAVAEEMNGPKVREQIDKIESVAAEKKGNGEGVK